MNRKINKITTWLAAAIFLLALAINVKVTLDDPFMMLSDEAIAQTTTSTSSDSSSCWLNDLGEWICDTFIYIYRENIGTCTITEYEYYPGTERIKSKSEYPGHYKSCPLEGNEFCISQDCKKD